MNKLNAIFALVLFTTLVLILSITYFFRFGFFSGYIKIVNEDQDEEYTKDNLIYHDVALIRDGMIEAYASEAIVEGDRIIVVSPSEYKGSYGMCYISIVPRDSEYVERILKRDK